MDTASLLSVMAATAVNSAMPGPCMILIAARTAQGGSGSGLRTSLGIAAAQMIYAVVALTLLLLAMRLSETVQTVIRLAGAGLLLILAAKMLMQTGPAPVEDVQTRRGSDALVGLGVGLSSPFNLVFMFSILPQFVAQDSLPDASVVVLLAAIFLATMGPMLATIWVASGARAIGARFVPLMVRTGAVILMAFAVMSIASVA